MIYVAIFYSTFLLYFSGFIKAEIASFADFQKLHDGQPSMAKIKDAGKYRQEGKQYVMQDGDIVLFQFNVSDSKKK